MSGSNAVGDHCTGVTSLLWAVLFIPCGGKDPSFSCLFPTAICCGPVQVVSVNLRGLKAQPATAWRAVPAVVAHSLYSAC